MYDFESELVPPPVVLAEPLPEEEECAGDGPGQAGPLLEQVDHVAGQDRLVVFPEFVGPEVPGVLRRQFEQAGIERGR